MDSGALANGIVAGDLICATTAYCGEGASQYYIKDTKYVSASPNLVNEIKRKKLDDNIQIHTGPIFTTSVLFAERKKEIEQ